MQDEATVLLETAQSVAHDFIDAIIRLKASERILQDRVDTNSNAALTIIQERQRQIDTLTSQVIELSGSKEEIEKHKQTITSLEETCNSHLSAIKSLKAYIVDVEQENASQKVKWDDIIKRADSSTNALNIEIMERDESLKSRNETILALNSKLAFANGTLVRLNQEWDEEKARREKAEAMVIELTAKIDKLTKPVIVKTKKKS